MEKINREPTLNGLVETALFVGDLDLAADFYEKALGLPKLRTSGIGRMFRLGEQRYLLLFNRKAAQTPNKTDSGDVLPPCALPEQNGRGPGHIAFGISEQDLDFWRARLRKHDVDLLKEISWETGAHSLYFRDPDGHLIELATAGIWEPA
jgi:catechol 2,3-dioxygenase-like lactoylglutathione lyase family enzyme